MFAQIVQEHVTAPVTTSLAVTSVRQERRCQIASKVKIHKND